MPINKPSAKPAPVITVKIEAAVGTPNQRRLFAEFWRKLLVPATEAEKETPLNQAIAGGEGEHNGY